MSWRAVIRVILIENLSFKIELPWCPENREHLEAGESELTLLQWQGERQLWKAVLKREGAKEMVARGLDQ